MRKFSVLTTLPSPSKINSMRKMNLVWILPQSSRWRLTSARLFTTNAIVRSHVSVIIRRLLPKTLRSKCKSNSRRLLRSDRSMRNLRNYSHSLKKARPIPTQRCPNLSKHVKLPLLRKLKRSRLRNRSLKIRWRVRIWL